MKRQPLCDKHVISHSLCIKKLRGRLVLVTFIPRPSISINPICLALFFLVLSLVTQKYEFAWLKIKIEFWYLNMSYGGKALKKTKLVGPIFLTCLCQLRFTFFFFLSFFFFLLSFLFLYFFFTTPPTARIIFFLFFFFLFHSSTNGQISFFFSPGVPIKHTNTNPQPCSSA